MAKLRAPRTRSELARNLVFIAVFGAFGVLMLATRSDDWPSVVLGAWLVALWLGWSAWLVWARSVWMTGRDEDVVNEPRTVRAVYLRAGCEGLFLAGWEFFAAVSDAHPAKKALFLVLGAGGFIVIVARARRALDEARRVLGDP